MATIVKHKESGKHLILLGAGFGAYKSASTYSSGLLLSGSNTDSGELPMIAVAFSNGEIHWCSSDDVEVISIDGKSPTELLKDFN